MTCRGLTHDGSPHPKVGHVFDIFACALDQAGGGAAEVAKARAALFTAGLRCGQVGVAEMRAVVERTGGYTVMSESFTGESLKQRSRCSLLLSLPELARPPA